MISKISPELRKHLKSYHKKWLRVGLCTEPADRDRAEYAIGEFYSMAGLARPGFVWRDSPLECALTWKEVGNEILGTCLEHEYADSWPTDRGQYLSDWHKLGETFCNRLHAALADALEELLLQSMRNRTWFTLVDYLADAWSLSYRDIEDELWWSSHHGQHEAHWIAYSLFRRDVLGFENTRSRQLDLWAHIAESCNWWWPYERFCIISERPKRVRTQRWRKSFRLHCETGPAVEFRDGWGVYVVNGVSVPKDLGVKPADEFDPRMLLTEENAQVRCEIVRKIGMERISQELGAETIDAQGDYELVLLDLQDDIRRPYLKMINPSVGTYHLEGVPPDCETVAEALTWRNSTESSPAVLT